MVQPVGPGDVGPGRPGSLRVAHGAVTGVRAFPSREVTVITVEIPDDFHVEATSLLYGRDALVVRADLGVPLPYGVLSPDVPAAPEIGQVERTTPTAGGAGATAPKIHGAVSIIRPVPSRGVT